MIASEKKNTSWHPAFTFYKKKQKKTYTAFNLFLSFSGTDSKKVTLSDPLGFNDDENVLSELIIH